MKAFGCRIIHLLFAQRTLSVIVESLGMRREPFHFWARLCVVFAAAIFQVINFHGSRRFLISIILQFLLNRLPAPQWLLCRSCSNRRQKYVTELNPTYCGGKFCLDSRPDWRVLYVACIISRHECSAGNRLQTHMHRPKRHSRK